MRNHQKMRAISLLFAGVFTIGCLSACARAGQGPASQPAPTPEPAPLVRPALAEPEPPALPPARLVNGDFEQGFDEEGLLPGWTVTFGEWGEGDAAAAYSLSAEQDNPENTTQKLSLYNGLAKPVEFTISQTVEGLAAGEYVVSLIFEGGPANAQSGSQLWVNGIPTELGRYNGWCHWKQVVSQRFAVEEGGAAVIEIRGRMNSKDWMDLDDIELVPAAEFRARSFTGSEGGKDRTDAVFAYEQLTNGEFEAPEDEYGRLIGWTVEFADWGSGEKRAGYRLTTEKENYNTTQKLSLGNSTGAGNSFTVSQQFWVYESGEYVLAFDWEADGEGLTDPSLHLNGRYTLLGHGDGWKNWKQAVSAPVYFEKGTIAHIEIGGPMEDGGWMDIDNVIFVPAASFEPKRFPHFAPSQGDTQAQPADFIPLDHIQNGSFTQGVVWDDPRYPNGYLPGWALPASIDWDKWRFNTASGSAFEVNNLSNDAVASLFTISQLVRLKPGTYHLRANSPWLWDDEDTVSAVTVTVSPAAARSRAAGGLPVSLLIKPGYGEKESDASDAFTLAEETLVDVTVAFSLTGGKTAAVKGIEFVKEEVPAPTTSPGPGATAVVWESAAQAGGDSNKADSTTVDIVFSQQIPGLTADNFTVSGAVKGALTGGENGIYWLGISGLTVGNGETVTVSVTPPPGYAITPASQGVQVWKKAEAEEFSDPIQNGDFSRCSTWPVPDGWALTLGGSPVTGWDAYSGWVGNHPDSSIGIEDGKSGISFYGATATALEGFSLTQEVTLKPGNYRLHFELADSAWNIVFSIAGARLETGDGNSAGAVAGSVDFTIDTESACTVSVSKSGTWASDYFKLTSLSIEKLS